MNVTGNLRKPQKVSYMRHNVCHSTREGTAYEIGASE